MEMTRNLEQALEARAQQALETQRGLRSPRTEDVFTQRYPIGPDDFYVENYVRPRPLAAFNPGALLEGDRVYLFPRLIFDYYSYASSIGVTTVGAEALLTGRLEKPLRTRIVLWPQRPWEAVKGCEDARVAWLEETIWVLYTGVGKHEEEGREVRKSVLGGAELERDGSFTVRRKGFFAVVGTTEDERLVPPNKDSALLNVQGHRATMLTRPSLRGLPELCWRAEANLQELTIAADSLQPVLAPEPWEYKVGWSTNAIPLSNDEYLVGWHGVLKEDLSYRNGLALVDAQGRLRAVSDYLLAPQGLWEEYGDRPLTIFGDGLLRYGDALVWIGGVGDYCVGVFVADLREVLKRLRPVERA
jgi:predicted GH43/DUF377 family glycosyl hydrolase